VPESSRFRRVDVSDASTRIERFVKQNGTASDRRNVKELTLLYLVRHCQSSGQEPDASLTALGLEQAERLAAFLRPLGIARIVSSPYLRARQSVEPLARQLGLAVETDERLIERVLSAEPLDDWRERLRAAWDDHDLVLPGGESSRQATARGMAAVTEVLAGGRQPAVVASHGNLISLLLHAFDGRPGFATWEQLTNPDVFEVAYEPATDQAAARWLATRRWRP
jgi:2,3-bisphosphoglycerate-dependent phosphoglycerate mutase